MTMTWNGARMSNASWETAKRCPTCGSVGKEAAKRPAPSGNGFMLTLRCSNKTCSDQSVPWYVQVRSDGTIPEPHKHTAHTASIDRGMVNPQLAQQIRDALQMSLDISTKPGGGEVVR